MTILTSSTQGIDTPVWTEGMADWAPARTRPEFVQLNGPPPPPPPPAAQRSSAPTAVPPPTAFAPNTSDLIYPSEPPKSEGLCFLGILWTGIPQIIYGQTEKGLLLVGIGLILSIAAISTCVLIVLFIPYMVATIVDAYKVGLALKRGRPVGKWEWFPTTT
jgi:hypothetical protein